MKYQQGTFITVPNKDIIKGQPPHVQVLFMWLCHYANTTGECFPSYDTLQRNCGMSRRQVIYAMKQLIELGIVEKNRQTVEGRQTTNLYSVHLGVQDMHPQECTPCTPEGAGDAPRTKSIGTSSIGTQKGRVIPRKDIQPRNAHVRATIAGIARELTSR